jgi:hypothetical protein
LEKFLWPYYLQLSKFHALVYGAHMRPLILSTPPVDEVVEIVLET